MYCGKTKGKKNYFYMRVHSLQTMGTTEGQFNADICRILPSLRPGAAAWKGRNRDLWSFCTDRNVLIYTLSVHGHSRRPAVWESCPVWWHRDRSGCLSPALSSKHMQLNLDWLRLTTDAARPPENWTHCPSSPFSTGCCVFFFSGASARHLWFPRRTPYHRTHKHLSVSGSTRRAQRAADWSWFA